MFREGQCGQWEDRHRGIDSVFLLSIDLQVTSTEHWVKCVGSSNGIVVK